MPVNAHVVIHTDGIYTLRLTEVLAQTDVKTYTHTDA